jgi:hypothetical protein
VHAFPEWFGKTRKPYIKMLAYKKVYSKLATFIGFLLLFSPLVAIDVYSNREFDLTLSENLEKWSFAKYLAALIVFLYCIYLLVFGHEYVVVGELYSRTDSDDVFNYYLFPGFCLSAIIYSKPVGYLFGQGATYDGSSMTEDISFILGWCGLIFFTLGVVIEA